AVPDVPMTAGPSQPRGLSREVISHFLSSIHRVWNHTVGLEDRWVPLGRHPSVVARHKDYSSHPILQIIQDVFLLHRTDSWLAPSNQRQSTLARSTLSVGTCCLFNLPA